MMPDAANARVLGEHTGRVRCSTINRPATLDAMNSGALAGFETPARDLDNVLAAALCAPNPE